MIQNLLQVSLLGDNTTVITLINILPIFFQRLKATQNLEGYMETECVRHICIIPFRMKPAWLLIKETTQTRNWVLYDNKRVGYNPNQYEFLPDTENAEDIYNKS